MPRGGAASKNETQGRAVRFLLLLPQGFDGRAEGSMRFIARLFGTVFGSRQRRAVAVPTLDLARTPLERRLLGE